MSEKILLTQLGTGNYQQANYQFGDHVAETEVFFSVALARHLQPVHVISLETQLAADTHGENYAARINELGFPHRRVSIPEGKNESELWEIFSALTAHIPENAVLHLDITHGFRSLPMLGLIALNYLRVVRKVSIGGIHYGAWESRESCEVGGIPLAPVFDLTPFLKLLDWTSAADQFLSTGDASRLARLLEEIQQDFRKRADPAAELPSKLKNLAASIRKSSESLLLLRTGAFAANAQKLTNQLEKTHFETHQFAPPFLQVLESVRRDLTRFSNLDLATLRDLIVWLAEKNQTAASLTLASEWLVSYIMIANGHAQHHASHKTRTPYSLVIKLLEFGEKEMNPDENLEAAKQFQAKFIEFLSADELSTFKAISSRIRTARNDINHAGFNENAAAATALATCAREIGEKLSTLPLPTP